MLADTQIFLCWIALSATSFWLIPSSLPTIRQWWLVGTSVLLVLAFAPVACALVLWIWFVTAIAPRFFARHRSTTTLTIFLLLVCLPLLAQRVVFLDASILATLGVTFATLRAAGIAFDSYVTRSATAARDVGLCLFFLPLYTVGPMQSLDTFKPENFTATPPYRSMARGLSRSCLGLFKTVYIADTLIRGHLSEHYPTEGRDFSTYDSPEVLLFVLLSFAYTYVNFSGFVDIALGVSRLFGLTVMENFNYPFLARNLQEFWKRWHISLGQWISRYLYFPVVAKLRTSYAPYAATFVAFVIVGWWHDTTANYIAWGALHGAGLCLVMFWQRSMRKRFGQRYRVLANHPGFVALSWSLTLIYVAWVQTFANLKTFDAALLMTGALLGITSS